MATFCVIYLYGISAGLVVMMIWQYLRRKHDLMSLRNFFLAGFIVFQTSSTAMVLLGYEHPQYRLVNVPTLGLEFCALATLVLALFLISYHKGWGVRRLASRLPVVTMAPHDTVLIATACALTVLAFVLRFGVRVPMIGLASGLAGAGCAAIACGLAGWVVARRAWNFPLYFVLFTILAANLANVLWGAFGRRPLVAMIMAALWGMYYSRWRFLPARYTLIRVGVLTLAAVLLVALYSSVRSSYEHDRSAAEHLNQVVQKGNVSSGMMLLLTGQNTGSGSLWLIQAYPEQFEYRPLMTLRYMFMYPIPRDLWPGKPTALCFLIPAQANFEGVPIGRMTIGPGIVGSAAAEGGWYAAIIYAVFFGLMMRFFDEFTSLYPYSPFVVLLVAADIGQIIGLPRGETGSFAAVYLLTVAGAWLCTYLIARPFQVGRTAPVPAPS